MKYQIGHFVLDTQARTLTSEDSCQSIRPKTLALLLYLAQRSGKVISKQTLLDCVWDDVTVDDGVIFQSVREIRQLFSLPQIIQNYPRKGYEFTEQFVAIEQRPKQSLKASAVLRYFLIVILILLLTGLVSYFLWTKESEITYEQSILVLPVKNHVPYAQNDWIYLGAMEQLIAKLNGFPPSVFVYQGNYVSHLMHTVAIERVFDSSDVRKIFSESGATLIVETELHGNVYDYKLVYKFHMMNDIKQGVILNTSINEALTTLAEKIAVFINLPLQQFTNYANDEFSDALFAEAMISYESDWQTSISFFESYLALNPDSVIAMIYLSKLYLWSDDIEQALSLINNAARLTKQVPQEIAHIKLIRGKIAAKQKDWQLTMQFYSQASELLEAHSDWFLRASIAEAQGLAYLDQSLLQESLESFNAALSYYQIIQSPIGINSTRLHLANVFFLQGNIAQGIKNYRESKRDIQHIKLEFLYSMLADYESTFEKYLVSNAY